MKSYFYIIVPKHRCNSKMNDGSDELVIKSDNVYMLLFLRSVLEIDTGVFMGHINWTVHSSMIDVKDICDNYKYDIGQDGGVIFNDLMKQFRVNLKLHWGAKFENKIYRKVFNNAYSKYRGVINRPRKDMIYNCLLESADAWVDNKKRFNNLVIPVEL